MLNFTVGPVMSSEDILEVSGQSAPYFRTPEFSEIMKENEKMMLEFLAAPSGSRCAFLTASGTGVMEAVVMSILNDSDKAIVINGGAFGQRFVDLCRLHRIEHSEIKLEFECTRNEEELECYENKSYTALLINMCETSSGVLYDMDMVSEFCRRNKILLIIDAISSFLADRLEMSSLDAAVVITSSQKALALHPGISMITMSPVAIDRVERNPEKSLYLSIKEALINGVRGQTPFTPAVTILLQLNKRLKEIKSNGGVEAEHKKIAHIAEIFRNSITGLPLEIFSESKSNAVTALRVKSGNAKEIINRLKDEYGIWVCPNGGEIGNTVFRVGHIGFICDEDIRCLSNALSKVLL